jgi:hypothetical protein
MIFFPLTKLSLLTHISIDEQNKNVTFWLPSYDLLPMFRVSMFQHYEKYSWKTLSDKHPDHDDFHHSVPIDREHAHTHARFDSIESLLNALEHESTLEGLIARKKALRVSRFAFEDLRPIIEAGEFKKLKAKFVKEKEDIQPDITKMADDISDRDIFKAKRHPERLAITWLGPYPAVERPAANDTLANISSKPVIHNFKLKRKAEVDVAEIDQVDVKKKKGIRGICVIL